MIIITIIIIITKLNNTLKPARKLGVKIRQLTPCTKIRQLTPCTKIRQLTPCTKIRQLAPCTKIRQLTPCTKIRQLTPCTKIRQLAPCTKSVERIHEAKFNILRNQQVRTDSTIFKNKPNIIIHGNKKGI